MELKQLLTTLLKNKKTILSLGAIFLLVGLVVTEYIPTSYQASFVFTVSRQSQPESDQFFAYDGYYAQQTSEKVSDMLVGVLRTDEIVKLALESANFPTNQEEIKKTSKSIKVGKVAPQVVFVKVKGVDSEKAESVSGALRGLVLSNAPSKTVIDFVNKVPLVSGYSSSAELNAVVGLLVGGLVGVVIVLFKEYFK